MSANPTKAPVSPDNRLHLRPAVAMSQHIEQTQTERVQHMHGQRHQKEEEEPIVAPADAVVHPRTVVVERLDAVIADRAVRAARRSVELTGDAPLHAHGDAIDLGVLVQRRPELVFAVLVWWRCAEAEAISTRRTGVDGRECGQEGCSYLWE